MNIAIIIAGGSGHRFGTKIPKQYIMVNNEPVIWYTLSIFQDAKCIDNIVVVCTEEWKEYIKTLKSTHNLSKLTDIVKSGDTRFNSIYNGIIFCCSQYDKQDILVIHDAVRPCITEELLEDNITMAKVHGAALATSPCFDTMFISSNG
jgi:2-C-methyl-D-erythritol 4-phosphate cytidylyltransferase